MRRHVVTLSEKEFGIIVNRLEGEIAASGFSPDAVLSIRRGGEFIGKSLFPDKPHYAVTLQRPGTRHKNGIMKKLIHHLPRYILDQLRILESWWLSKHVNRLIPQHNIQLPGLYKYQNILIVDDAVDSGATLRSVLNAVKSQISGQDIRTAVITITTPTPLIHPDFYIYNNLTLVRFPWSIDS